MRLLYYYYLSYLLLLITIAAQCCRYVFWGHRRKRNPFPPRARRRPAVAQIRSAVVDNVATEGLFEGRYVMEITHEPRKSLQQCVSAV